MKWTFVTAFFLMSNISSAGPEPEQPTAPTPNAPAVSTFHGDMDSWTNIPPLPPGPHTKSEERNSHCGITDFHHHEVEMYSTEKVCKDWLAASAELSAHGPTQQQIADYLAAQKAKKIAAEPIVPGVIYAIFQCQAAPGTCQLMDRPHMSLGSFVPGTTYNRLSECQDAAETRTQRRPAADGRFVFADGPYGMWWECRRRHVETWEPAR